MRPYYAILQDCFREALSSRTLQVLLTLIVVLLLGLAVPGLKFERPAELQREDVLNADGLARTLGRTRDGGMTDAQQYLRDNLSPGLQAAFAEYRRDASTANREAAIGGLVDELNQLAGGKRLYDAEAWQDVSLTREGQALLAEDWDELSPDEQRRLNRLLIDGALEGYVQAVRPVRGAVTYLVGEMDLPIPADGARKLVQQIVYGILKWFVGAAGMLAAIIFTASMIPQMFEPGAIDLLLSKPVSRSGAFLAKFAGGCAFIVLNGSLFVVGLWLILGLRHGDWNARLLLAIPVFILAFTIYFSISAFVGVRWRNPVLAIALTLVVWITTFSLNLLWYFGQKLSLDGMRAEAVLATDDGPIVARKNGTVVEWRGERWQDIFEEQIDDPTVTIQRGTGLMYPLFGPVLVHRDGDRTLVAVERNFRPPMFFTAGDVVIGNSQDQLRRIKGPAAPSDLTSIHATAAQEVLLICRSGIQRIDFGAVKKNTDADIRLTPLGPERANWQEPIDAAVDRDSGDVVIYTRGRLLNLQRQGDRYEVSAEHDTADASAALVGLLAETVVLTRQDGAIERYQRGALSPREGIAVGLSASPKQVAGSPDGSRLLILDHQRRVHEVTTEGPPQLAGLRGQRNLTALAFTSDGDLLAADRLPRVTRYNQSGGVEDSWEWNEGFAWAFQWLIHPLRTVLPNPDELDQLVRHAVGAVDDSDGPLVGDLRREREYVDLWTPVWTSILFVAVMLAITCWMIERRDY